MPHSGHSGGVSGRVGSDIVFSTSTNGTAAAMPAQRSGRRFSTAPISMPPAEPPCATIRPGSACPPSIRRSAQAMKSVKLLVLRAPLPSRNQPQPFSEPPRMWAVAQIQPRSTRLSDRIEKPGIIGMP